MINAAGAELITRKEGIRLKAYFCPAGVPTIGRGHTAGITAEMVRDGYTITADEERALFQADMEQWERDVLSSLTRAPNENQLAAFISLAFNIGISGFRNSTVVRRFEAGDDVGAAEAFSMWNKATIDGVKTVLPGLVARRAEEAALFLTPVSGSAPMPQAIDKPEPPKGKSMLQFILAALPALFNAVPPLVSALGSGSERSEKNLKAVTAVVEIAKTAVGAVNEQELVAKLESDPAAVAAVKEAIEKQWFTIVDIAGVPEARKADLAFVQAKGNPLQSPAFLVALVLVPLVYMIVAAVVGLIGEPFSPDVRAAIANGIVGLILGSIAGFYFGGVAAQSGQRKTDTPSIDR